MQEIMSLQIHLDRHINLEKKLSKIIGALKKVVPQWRCLNAISVLRIIRLIICTVRAIYK